MQWLKNALSDFPNQNATTATALLLIFVTGMTVNYKLLMSQPFPAGYDTFLWVLVALSGDRKSVV